MGGATDDSSAPRAGERYARWEHTAEKAVRRPWSCSATLRPACKEGSCMDPTRRLQAPYGPRFGDGVRPEPSMERRTFVALVSAGLLAAPLAADALQVHRIGVLLFSTPTTDPQLEAFRKGLRELGYVEGRNVTFDRSE